MNRLTAEEMLALNKYVVDDEAHHITLNREICAACSNQACVYVCPAGLYTLKDGEINFDDAGCLECGTCRVICPQAISWQYPRSSFGVIYRYG